MSTLFVLNPSDSGDYATNISVLALNQQLWERSGTATASWPQLEQTNQPTTNSANRRHHSYSSEQARQHGCNVDIYTPESPVQQKLTETRTPFQQMVQESSIMNNNS